MSTFAYLITIILKEDGSSSLCTDCRKANCQLYPFPMSRVDEIINETGGCSGFLGINLSKGFWRVPLEGRTRHLNAFVTPLDMYWLPFGWKKPGAWFQKMMNELLKNFLGHVWNIYVNDIIVYSKHEKNTLTTCPKFLKCWTLPGWKSASRRANSSSKTVVFLGRSFDDHAESNEEDSVWQISKLRKPYDLHSPHEFLGVAGHFQAFIKDCHENKVLLLTQQNTLFVWSDKCNSVYNYLVKVISTELVLALPDFKLPLQLCIDATFYKTGAVPYQSCVTCQALWKVIGYHSYTFSKTQKTMQ